MESYRKLCLKRQAELRRMLSNSDQHDLLAFVQGEEDGKGNSNE